jgi:hypothetical protein
MEFTDTLVQTLVDSYSVSTTPPRAPVLNLVEVKGSTLLEAETTVVEVSYTSTYMVEGYIDLSKLTGSDIIVITEEIALDGANYRVYAVRRVDGLPDEPLLRFHSKLLPSNSSYRITLKWIAGLAKSLDYAFVVAVFRT